MSLTRPVAFLVSCGVHVVFVVSLWGPPPPAPVPVKVNRTVEMELRPLRVEARRTAPGPEKRQAVSTRRSSRPAVVRTVQLPATEHQGALVVEPAVDGEPGEEEVTGSGGGEDAGVVIGSSALAPRRDTRAEVIELPRLAYPERAREDGVDGVVRLWVQLDAQGNVISVEVREEPGSGLGEAARRAVLGATFRPATRGGERVGSSFEYLYRFELL